nr:unnamed protein product [Callosobruchus analis]
MGNCHTTTKNRNTHQGRAILVTHFCPQHKNIGVDLKGKIPRGNTIQDIDLVDPDILWTHSETLDKGGLVVLKWQPRHQEILFRVEARTRGYTR